MGSLNQIHHLFRSAYHLDKLDRLLSDSFNFGKVKYDKPDLLLEQLNSNVKEHQLNYLLKEIPKAEFNELIKSSEFPFFSLFKFNNEIQPLFFDIGEGSNRIKVVADGIDNEEIAIEELLDVPLLIENDSQLMCFVIVANPIQNIDSSATTRFKVLSRFLKLVKHEKREIGYVYLYASIAGIISLSLPLGIQSIIGFVSSGQSSTSLVVLICFIILGILISGLLQIAQISIVEHIQQRIFSRTAFDFAFRIPKLNIESLSSYYAPELVNRFFDVITLQKGFSKILLDFSAATLQILLGLVLLSFYHPYFIIFGLLLILVLVAIMYFTGPLGLKTSLNESKYKYKLAHWLEEVARTLGIFKLAGYSQIPQLKADYFTGNYLHARSKHFKILIFQYLSFVFFKVLITAILLIIGCYLVINKEINIGQFVASEIVIILIMNAVEKVVINLESVYDVLTSLEKIGQIGDLPIEDSTTGYYLKNSSKKGMDIKVSDLTYCFADETKPILNSISFEVHSGEIFGICGKNGQGKSTLVNLLNGLYSRFKGEIAFDTISMRDIDKNHLYRSIGENLLQDAIFEGTLFENITLNVSNIGVEEVYEAIDLVRLRNYVQRLDNGLKTEIAPNKNGLNSNIAQRISLARALAKMPKVIMIDDFGITIDKSEKIEIYSNIVNRFKGCTIIFISNSHDVLQLCNKIGYMEKGTLSVFDREAFFNQPQCNQL